MKHRRLSLFAHLLALLLCTLVLVSCEGRGVSPRLDVERLAAEWKDYLPQYEEFYNDAVTDYQKTRQVLISLGLPQELVSRLTADQLAVYADAKQIVTLTSGSCPQLCLTYCVDGKGNIHQAIDAVWEEMPEERYVDCFSATFEAGASSVLSDDSGWLMYGEERRILVAGEDFEQWNAKGKGYVYDLGDLTDGLERVEGEKLYLHFEGQLLLQYPARELYTNFYLNYDHSLTPHDGKTEIGYRNLVVCFLYDSKSEMVIKRSELVTLSPFYYVPFTN